MATGTVKTLGVTVPIPTTVPSGTYYVVAIADPANAIAETDETNDGATGNTVTR